MTSPLPRPLLAEGKQPAKPRIGVAVGGKDQQRQPVVEVEPTADDEPDSGGFGGLTRPNDSGKGVAVDEPERLDTGGRRLREQLLAGRGAAQ